MSIVEQLSNMVHATGVVGGQIPIHHCVALLGEKMVAPGTQERQMTHPHKVTFVMFVMSSMCIALYGLMHEEHLPYIYRNDVTYGDLLLKSLVSRLDRDFPIQVGIEERDIPKLLSSASPFWGKCSVLEDDGDLITGSCSCGLWRARVSGGKVETIYLFIGGLDDPTWSRSIKPKSKVNVEEIRKALKEIRTP